MQDVVAESLIFRNCTKSQNQRKPSLKTKILRINYWPAFLKYKLEIKQLPLRGIFLVFLSVWVAEIDELFTKWTPWYYRLKFVFCIITFDWFFFLSNDNAAFFQKHAGPPGNLWTSGGSSASEAWIVHTKRFLKFCYSKYTDLSLVRFFFFIIMYALFGIEIIWALHLFRAKRTRKHMSAIFFSLKYLDYMIVWPETRIRRI